MGVSRFASATVLFIILVAGLGLASRQASGAQADVQACVDVQSAPVLQDFDWQVLNPANNYSNFATRFDEPSVVKTGSTYVAYVREDVGIASGGIFRGTSSDGVNWVMSSTPVLPLGDNGTWDSRVVFSPDVVWNGTGYLMYYVGDGANVTTQTRQIGVAFSSDGIVWTKSASNPIIVHGPGVYDARYTRGPSVIFDGGAYKMWYTGSPDLNNITTYYGAVDYATSADGVHWMKYQGNPVFNGYFYADGTTQAYWPSVVKANGSYIMAFSDGFTNIGLATSQDGIVWRFDNQSAPLVSGISWHNGFVGNPSLLLDGRQLLLWYSGSDNQTQTSPYTAGVGFARCGILVAQPPSTTTISVLSTSSVTETVTSTSRSTATSVATTVETSVVTSTVNPALPTFQALTAFAGGVVVALGVAVALIWNRVRKVRRAPGSAA